MNLLELKEKLNNLYIKYSDYDLKQIEIGIKTDVVSAIGGTYITPVKNINKGFDWDKNKFIIIPEKDLRETDKDELSKLRKEASDIGWNIYENRNLKREIKKLQKRIKELEENLNSNKTTKICENKIDGVCSRHNLFCSYPDCEK